MTAEPKHVCSQACSFTVNQICKATGNKHTCSQACTVLNDESQYVCTFTGLVLSAAQIPQTPAVLFKTSSSKQQQHPAKTSQNVLRWITTAARLFLTSTERRVELRNAAVVRILHKIKRNMGPLPWSARRLAAVNSAVLDKSTHALNLTIKAAEDDEFIGWLAAELLAYYSSFAAPVFKCTRTGIGTYTAVMIAAMATGVHDVNGIWIVEKDAIVAKCCPPLIDYPKLAPAMTTCKSMSNGLFALRSLAMSNHGQARKKALFRPTPFLQDT